MLAVSRLFSRHQARAQVPVLSTKQPLRELEGVREQNTSICCSRGRPCFWADQRNRRSASPWLLPTLICRTLAAGNEKLDDWVADNSSPAPERGKKREITDSGTAHKTERDYVLSQIEFPFLLIFKQRVRDEMEQLLVVEP